MKLINKLSLLAIDDLSNTTHIKHRIQELKELSFDGIVFHPRYYLDTPKYLSDKYMKAVSEIIVFAKSLDMEFWIYDENGWPSGSASGKVLKQLPDMTCARLEFHDGDVKIILYKDINTIDFECIKTFIELTHDAYKTKLSKEAFGHVAGFFSDEAGFLNGHGAGADFGGVPWHDDLADEYNQLYNENIYSRLPELFAPENSGSEFKARYWEMLSKRLHDCFYGQIQKWCSDNNKEYMAHLKGEESPYFQISYNGSCLQALKDISLPGVDTQGRKPSNSYYPRIASSLAMQFGNGDSMCEALGGSGWGFSPQDLEDNMKWLIECGINTFVFHISQLKLANSNITDWPPSFPTHLPWKEAMPQIFEKMEKLAETEFKLPRKILTIIPNRAISENYVPNELGEMSVHDGQNPPKCYANDLSEKAVEMCNRLHNMGRRFDITDELILEKFSTFTGDGISIGKATYSTIILAPGCSFSKKGEVAIERAKANGVRILKDIPISDTGVIPIEQIRKATQEIISLDTTQNDWTISYPKENRFWLKPEYSDTNATCTFEVDDDFKADNIMLLISNPAKNVSINNIIVQLNKSDEFGYYYDITQNILAGKNTILIEGCENITAFLLGKFRATAKNGYLLFDEKQVQTKYNFILQNESVESNTNLTEKGYPFCFDCATAKKIIVIDANVNKPYVKLDCTYVSAMEVFFDNNSIGFVYGENNIIELPSITAGEQHVIEIKAYSSAFNSYGPHFYFMGDANLISPDQFAGVRNFLDFRHDSEYTLNDNMKFVMWTLPKNIEIIQQF